jgi:hypothetical protein
MGRVDRLRMEPLALADLGGGRYVVETRGAGTGRSSGIEVDQRMGLLNTLREQDGKVARVQIFPTRDAALEAAGPPDSGYIDLTPEGSRERVSGRRRTAPSRQARRGRRNRGACLRIPA